MVPFDALEVTDAVVAAGRSFLALDGVLVTAAHPTIALLLLYVAAEFPATDERSVVWIPESSTTPTKTSKPRPRPSLSTSICDRQGD